MCFPYTAIVVPSVVKHAILNYSSKNQNINKLVNTKSRYWQRYNPGVLVLQSDIYLSMLVLSLGKGQAFTFNFKYKNDSDSVCIQCRPYMWNHQLLTHAAFPYHQFTWQRIDLGLCRGKGNMKKCLDYKLHMTVLTWSTKWLRFAFAKQTSQSELCLKLNESGSKHPHKCPQQ